MKKVLQLCVAGSIVLSLAACTGVPQKGAGPYNAGNANNVRPYTTYQNNDAAGNKYGMGAMNLHANTRVESSQYLADQIAAMDEVSAARVLVTDNNVYVAVQLKNNNINQSNVNRTPTGNVTTRTAGPDKPYGGATTRDGLTNGMGSMGTHGGGNINRGPVPNAIDMRGSRAYSDSTYNSSGTMMSQDVKQKIVTKVRSLCSPNVRHVFVTANPDFYGRINNYANDLKAGKPISGLVTEFNDMARRVFPTTAEGTITNRNNVTPNVTPTPNGYGGMGTR
ncbi:lipoprotein-like protein [Paenibacillus larvae subsp. larvae]|uniref:Lipoprotein-like protein n=2 Tax=Paenibacillus larvae TaxID=1464 RepID=A0A2L1UFP6_9BACL|nr:YhcN/YlaJ family sporulation lipoprotein [Paenibacillus larvae]AQT83753.1 hypothetical protein B1222_03955 [Paenibacillus larvae subsp. pulvifaciens]AQZ48902.1 hypothetical protein B5S25_22270 [Paenibacillus larvae subsp. pulvifaciens]ARF69813.1 hypothetical protein B7C51_21200 [Paenibacillus larvae subsp. pulvifaciens]AVF27008.1 lipoprotein-like protein [Paenibacillus larvae subsp. larvae]AVF31755.1 lipoprotein-like protein [Paenibacillus larvae subsp. larvae]